MEGLLAELEKAGERSQAASDVDTGRWGKRRRKKMLQAVDPP